MGSWGVWEISRLKWYAVLVGLYGENICTYTVVKQTNTHAIFLISMFILNPSLHNIPSCKSQIISSIIFLITRQFIQISYLKVTVTEALKLTNLCLFVSKLVIISFWTLRLPLYFTIYCLYHLIQCKLNTLSSIIIKSFTKIWVDYYREKHSVR